MRKMLLFALVVMKDNQSKTINVGILSFRGFFNIDWGPIFAVLLIALIPMIVFYLIFHRTITKGIHAGALK